MLVIQDDSLWTPLLIAASAGHKEIAKMLIGNMSLASHFSLVG
jgi:hypothetical protein